MQRKGQSSDRGCPTLPNFESKDTPRIMRMPSSSWRLVILDAGIDTEACSWSPTGWAPEILNHTQTPADPAKSPWHSPSQAWEHLHHGNHQGYSQGCHLIVFGYCFMPHVLLSQQLISVAKVETIQSTFVLFFSLVCLRLRYMHLIGNWHSNFPRKAVICSPFNNQW